MPSEKVLIVDDEKLVRWSLRQKCEEWGYHVLEADNGSAALRVAHNESPDLVLLDVRLPDASGIEILEQLKKSGDARAVIMITADPQLEDVKTALKLGAYDFVGKPLDFDELAVAVKNALEDDSLALGSGIAARRNAPPHRLPQCDRRVAEDVGAAGLRQQDCHQRSHHDSGARRKRHRQRSHRQSHSLSKPRQEKPFVAINCSAIPETLMEAELFGHERGAFTDAKAMKKGLFEMADGGTLFLDEIGELSPLLQAKLLRVLEDQVIRRVGGVRDMQVDVRVIAASNRDLERAVRDNTFRQDLYYRLAIISIFLPPLRERKEDILPLVEFFIERYNRTFRKKVIGITDETRKLMLKYDWPGNVRELKNAVERAMILEETNELRPDYLPFAVAQQHSAFTAFEQSSGSNNGNAAGKALPDGRSLPKLEIPEGGTSLEEVERELVDLAMTQANGNQTHAAKLLDISRDALRYKLKKYGLIHAEEDEPSAATS